MIFIIYIFFFYCKTKDHDNIENVNSIIIILAMIIANIIVQIRIIIVNVLRMVDIMVFYSIVDNIQKYRIIKIIII